jgi:hypothetical protein
MINPPRKHALPYDLEIRFSNISIKENDGKFNRMSLTGRRFLEDIDPGIF